VPGHARPPAPPAPTNQLLGLAQADHHVARQRAVHVGHVGHNQHVGLRLARPQAVEVDGGVKGGHTHLQSCQGTAQLLSAAIAHQDGRSTHAPDPARTRKRVTNTCCPHFAGLLHTCVRSPPGSSSSNRATEEQTARVAPEAMAGWLTSIRKKWVGRMGGRTWYSPPTKNSMELDTQAGRGASAAHNEMVAGRAVMGHASCPSPPPRTQRSRARLPSPCPHPLHSSGLSCLSRRSPSGPVKHW
jgi:hypothetical protein